MIRNDMKRIIAYCGIVCSECEVYIATINNDYNLRMELAKRYTTADHIAKPEDFYCEGCFRIKGQGCEVRQCSSCKPHANCAGCDSYSCDLLNRHFENSPESKAVLDEIRKHK